MIEKGKKGGSSSSSTSSWIKEDIDMSNTPSEKNA